LKFKLSNNKILAIIFFGTFFASINIHDFIIFMKATKGKSNKKPTENTVDSTGLIQKRKGA